MAAILLLTLTLAGQSPDYDLLGQRLDRVDHSLDRILEQLDQIKDLIDQAQRKVDRIAGTAFPVRPAAPVATADADDRPWYLAVEPRGGSERIVVRDADGRSRVFIRQLAVARQPAALPRVSIMPAPTPVFRSPPVAMPTLAPAAAPSFGTVFGTSPSCVGGSCGLR